MVPIMLRISKRLLALLIGLTVSLALLWGLEKAFYHDPIYDETHAIQHEIRPNFYVKHATRGFSITESAMVRHVARLDDRVLYDVRYTIQDGRRSTFSFGQDDYFAVFVGCSFTFGIGLDDEETLPDVFAHHAPNFHVYNCGIGGYGIQQILLTLEELQPVEASGICVYTYIPPQVERLVGSPLAMEWNYRGPFVFFDRQDRLVVDGMIHEARPVYTWFMRFIAAHPFLLMRYPGVGRDDLTFAARVVERMAEGFESRFPASRFVVLFYPYLTDANPYPDFMIQELRRRGVEVLDYRDAVQYMGRIPYFADYHPRSDVWQHIGPRLARDLGVDHVLGTPTGGNPELYR